MNKNHLLLMLFPEDTWDIRLSQAWNIKVHFWKFWTTLLGSRVKDTWPIDPAPRRCPSAWVGWQVQVSTLAMGPAAQAKQTLWNRWWPQLSCREVKPSPLAVLEGFIWCYLPPFQGIPFQYFGFISVLVFCPFSDWVVYVVLHWFSEYFKVKPHSMSL